METITDLMVVEEPVVEFWESISRNWPEHDYDAALVQDLIRLFRQYGKDHSQEIVRVLDCGCGTGNPGIGLAKEGFEVVGVDNDAAMVGRFKQNCREENVSVPVLLHDWADLGKAFKSQPLFDAVICRGNSLIYSGSWEGMQFHPDVALQAIDESIKSMASVLRTGGILYVDVISAKEFLDAADYYEFVGVRHTEEHNVLIYWSVKHETENRARHVFGHRIFESKQQREPERITSHEFTGYLLHHDELIGLAATAGLTYTGKGYRLPSEWLYDGFLFTKS